MTTKGFYNLLVLVVSAYNIFSGANNSGRGRLAVVKKICHQETTTQGKSIKKKYDFSLFSQRQ